MPDANAGQAGQDTVRAEWAADGDEVRWLTPQQVDPVDHRRVFVACYRVGPGHGYRRGDRQKAFAARSRTG
jgi:hypothetical protein